MSFLWNESMCVDEDVIEPENDIPVITAPVTDLEARANKRARTNKRAHESTIKQCGFMANHYNKRLKATPDFCVGDSISVLIPRIEISSTDLPRLPGVIYHVNGTKDISYKVATIHGILSSSYRSADLQAYNGSILANTEKTITLIFSK